MNNKMKFIIILKNEKGGKSYLTFFLVKIIILLEK